MQDSVGKVDAPARRGTALESGLADGMRLVVAARCRSKDLMVLQLSDGEIQLNDHVVCQVADWNMAQ